MGEGLHGCRFAGVGVTRINSEFASNTSHSQNSKLSQPEGGVFMREIFARCALVVFLDSVLGHQLNAWPVGGSISATTRTHLLRDRVPNSSQIARWYGATGSGVNWPQAGGHIEADETYIGGRTRGKGRGYNYMVHVAGPIEVRQRKQ